MRRIVDLHPSSSNGRVTRPVVGRRLDRAGGTCSLAQRVRRASLVGLRSHGVRQLGTHLHMKLRPAQLRPLRPLRCCRRGPGRPSRCQVSHNSESGWGEGRMLSWRLKGPALMQPSPSRRWSSPPPNSTRVLEAAVVEQPTSPGTLAPAAARLPLSGPPPGAAPLRATDMPILPYGRVAMAALRCRLLVAVLLGLALLTAPDQASADEVRTICLRALISCSKRRLQCYECWFNCTVLSKKSPPGLSALSHRWASQCGRHKR